MPRHHAPLLTSIWDDLDFCSLSCAAQRMYMQLLSQKRLSLVGVLPYSLNNLARGCAELTPADIQASLDELAGRDYVIIDESTGEILVRTILKHDPPRGPKSIAGMWSHWREVDSPALKATIVSLAPLEAWTTHNVKPPDEANALRNGASDGASSHPRKGHPMGDSENEIEQPASTFHLPPSDTESTQHSYASRDDRQRIEGTVTNLSARFKAPA